jgi:hypothetical protein
VTSECTEQMISLPLGDTLPMTADWLVEQIMTQENR